MGSPFFRRRCCGTIAIESPTFYACLQAIEIAGLKAVEIPTHLTDRARSLLEDLGRELGEDVQPQRQSFLDKLNNLFG